MMIPSTIGIKLADGSFCPVIMTGTRYPTTLQLTTVHNNQQKIRVDVLIETAQRVDYLDSLTIDHLESKTAGMPTIELQMSFDDNNNLQARIVDLDSKYRQELCIPHELYAKKTSLSFFETVKRTKIIGQISSFR